MNVWWPDISVRGPVEEQELYWKLIALEELDGTSWLYRTPAEVVTTWRTLNNQAT